jgi:hypothetical protein
MRKLHRVENLIRKAMPVHNPNANSIKKNRTSIHPNIEKKAAHPRPESIGSISSQAHSKKVSPNLDSKHTMVQYSQETAPPKKNPEALKNRLPEKSLDLDSFFLGDNNRADPSSLTKPSLDRSRSTNASNSVKPTVRTKPKGCLSKEEQTTIDPEVIDRFFG